MPNTSRLLREGRIMILQKNNQKQQSEARQFLGIFNNLLQSVFLSI